MFILGMTIFLNKTEIGVNLYSPNFWSWGVNSTAFDEYDRTWDICAGPLRVFVNHRKVM